MATSEKNITGKAAGNGRIPSWLEWRGGPHVFPVTPQLSYREYWAEINVTDYGDGLLAPHDRNRIRSIKLPADISWARRAEMIVFGTGFIEGPKCQVNGKEVSLNSLQELAGKPDLYKTKHYSVNRVYSLSEIPVEYLKPGENVIALNRCHAYIQSVTLRLFTEAAPKNDLRLDVEQRYGDYELRIGGSVQGEIAEVQYFARYRGPDLEMNGESDAWQVTLNRIGNDPRPYAVSNHCGTAVAAPWGVKWTPELVPDGEILFRSRVILKDGLVIESAGGTVARTHDAPFEYMMFKAEDFAPFGFHECGAGQNFSASYEYRLEHETHIARVLEKAALLVPLYGIVRIEMNEEFKTFVEAPEGQYHLRTVPVPLSELFTRMNFITLKASRKTGCFQAPGPILYFAYRKQA